MSRANKQSQQPAKPRFDTKPYQRPGLNETDILEINSLILLNGYTVYLFG